MNYRNADALHQHHEAVLTYTCNLAELHQGLRKTEQITTGLGKKWPAEADHLTLTDCGSKT